ncbi:MAG: S1C family serine protease [Candidatus Omnitrophota bacterium]
MTIMDHQKSSWAILGFACLFFGAVLNPGVCKAATSPIPDRSQAFVAIRSVSVVRAGDKAGGVAALLSTQDPRRLAKYSRSGSGVIIDASGIIVTNAHLVQNAAGISVELFNGTRLEGRIIRILPESDLAFVSVRPFFPLLSVSVADSNRMVPGDMVYCIGRALNHNGALMGGKITALLKSSLSRTPRTEFLQIQFGFHLYGGDSGSPILDRKGNLVGLVSGGRRSGDMATIAIASNVIHNAFSDISK